MRKKPLKWVRLKPPDGVNAMGACMICTSHKPSSSGYPIFHVKGRRHRIHRYVCARKYGNLGSLQAMHLCDRKMCINPDHLVPGTNKQNHQQAADRNLHVFGENKGTAVLSNAEAIEIFKSIGTKTEIAKRYNVSRSTVSMIKSGKRWGKVTGA